MDKIMNCSFTLIPLHLMLVGLPTFLQRSAVKDKKKPPNGSYSKTGASNMAGP